MTENLKTELRERVLIIEMYRPEKKNALTIEMYAAFAAGLQRAASDKSVRSVLIQGQADCFTAGNDITSFVDNPLTDESPANEMIAHLTSLSKPIVAAVAGPAVGIGSTMLLHCDLVYAANNARFALPFVNLGLCPEAGSSLLLPRIAGEKRAAEVLLLGEPFDAVHAKELGIVSRICDPSAVLEVAMAAAVNLASKPARALRETKTLIRGDLEKISARVSTENAIFAELLVSDVAQEAMNAFLERRKPDFSKFDD